MIKVTVSIDVPDLKKAEAFYIEALGCKKKRDQGGMVILSTENCDIYLQEKETGTKSFKSNGGKTSRDYTRHWTPVHLDFLSDNVDELVAKVVALGGVYEGGECGDWGSIAYCADPFGNGFCIIDE